MLVLNCVLKIIILVFYEFLDYLLVIDNYNYIALRCLRKKNVKITAKEK
jgi:hypothetical protein